MSDFYKSSKVIFGSDSSLLMHLGRPACR